MLVPMLVMCAMGLALLAAPALGEPALRPHPRLLIDDASWTAFRDRVNRDASLAGVRSATLAEAEALLDTPPLTRTMRGRRLLQVSRNALSRVLRLSSAFHLTEDRRFLDRAALELRTVAAFDDFNPTHFLDVAEMGVALAIGYDWLHAHLDAPTRDAVREALRDKVLLAGGEKMGFWRATNNWNSVCLAGMSFAALAIAEHEPELTEQTLQRVRESFARGTAAYEPDGAFPEGPMYWIYGTSFAVLVIEAFRTGLGEVGPAGIGQGFYRSAEFRALCVGPSGLTFNYGDTGAGGAAPDPALYWFARHLNRPDLIHSLPPNSDKPQAVDRGDRLMPLRLIWTVAPDTGRTLPDHWVGHGQVPVAFHRRSASGQRSNNDLYVAIKAGVATASHAQLDAGSFVMDLDGVRWAVDLGMEDYTRVESAIGRELWNFKPDGGRWNLLRYHNRFHNTLTIGDAAQVVKGQTHIVDHQADPLPTTRIDLSPAYTGQAGAVTRTIALPDARTLVVTDEIAAVRDGIDWTMLTVATVQPTDRGATLNQKGKTVNLHVEASSDFTIELDRPDDFAQHFEQRQPKVSRIRIRLTGASKPRDVSIVVTLRGQ